MVPAEEAAARIQQIDDLQDEVLRRLDELERRTAQVLAEHLKASGTPAEPQPSESAAAPSPADKAA